MRHALLAIALAASGSCGPRDKSGDAGPAPAPVASSDGAALYTQQCMVCHGATGQGDGLASRYLFPKPRDFTQGKFKIRTTATGEVPTDGDLMATLNRGVPGTAMPAFSHLPERDKLALVAHIKSLSVTVVGDGTRVNRFERNPNPRVIVMKAERPATPELVRRGGALYKEQGCGNCHGPEGIGDGPSAASLKDDWGYPIPPVNFTRGLYKGGSSAADIYMRFTSGMSGTPMPSFEASLSDEDRWALAHFAKSLEKPGRPQIPAQKSDAIITALRVAKINLNPHDASWDPMPPTDIPLMHLWQRTEAPDIVRARVAHDGEHLGILLEWEDPKVDGLVLRPQDFSDASAVMFSLTDPPGHFTMGEKGKPCNIWHWRMDRQMDLAKYWDIEDVYPGMALDDYPLARDGEKKHRPPATAQSCDPTYLTGKGAGNPMSQTERVSAVEDLNSIGFGSLEAQPREMQNVQGRGAWSAGRWKVVFMRKMASPDAKDSQFKPGTRAAIGFAIWDGGSGDRNGQKSVTYWQILELAK